MIVATASAMAIATTHLAVVLPVLHTCHWLIVDTSCCSHCFCLLCWHGSVLMISLHCVFLLDEMMYHMHQASQEKCLRTVMIKCFTKAHCRSVMISWSLKGSRTPTKGRIIHYQNLLRDRTCQGNHLCQRDQKCCLWQSICLTHLCIHLEQEALEKSIQHIQVECLDVPVLQSVMLEPGTMTMTTTTTMSVVTGAAMLICAPIGMPALAMMAMAMATAVAAPVAAITAASTTMMVSILGIVIPFTAWTITAICVMGLVTVAMTVAVTNLNPVMGIEELFNQTPAPLLMSKGPSSIPSTLPMT